MVGKGGRGRLTRRNNELGPAGLVAVAPGIAQHARALETLDLRWVRCLRCARRLPPGLGRGRHWEFGVECWG